MIHLEKLPILKRFKFLRLSSRIQENKTIFPGKYILYKEQLYEYDNSYRHRIELLKDGKIGETDMDVSGYPWGWSVRIHEGVNMANQNSFDVKGLSTMEIIYADEKIIFALGYAKSPLLFIKEEFIDEFDTNDSILLYLTKVENYWVSEQNKLLSVTYSVDQFLNFSEPLGFWIPAIISILICVGLSCIDSWLWISLIAVFPIIMFIFRFCLKRWRRHLINSFKKENPDNKLANAVFINAFDFDKL